MLHPLGHLGAREVLHRRATLEHELRLEAIEVREEHQVGDVARGERAELAQAVPESRVQRSHHDRVLRGDSALDRAAAAGDFAVVETLLKHGASASVVTEDGTTPVMLLAGYSRTRTNAPLTDIPKRVELIRSMLENGADVHAVHKDSTNNALYFAKQRNAPEIVTLLEQFGAREATAAN